MFQLVVRHFAWPAQDTRKIGVVDREVDFIGFKLWVNIHGLICNEREPKGAFNRSGLAGPLDFAMESPPALRLYGQKWFYLGPAPGVAVKPAILTFWIREGERCLRERKGGWKAGKSGRREIEVGGR